MINNWSTIQVIMLHSIPFKYGSVHSWENFKYTRWGNLKQNGVFWSKGNKFKFVTKTAKKCEWCFLNSWSSLLLPKLLTSSRTHHSESPLSVSDQKYILLWTKCHIINNLPTGPDRAILANIGRHDQLVSSYIQVYEVFPKISSSNLYSVTWSCFT